MVMEPPPAKKVGSRERRYDGERALGGGGGVIVKVKVSESESESE